MCSHLARVSDRNNSASTTQVAQSSIHDWRQKYAFLEAAEDFILKYLKKEIILRSYYILHSKPCHDFFDGIESLFDDAKQTIPYITINQMHLDSFCRHDLVSKVRNSAE